MKLTKNASGAFHFLLLACVTLTSAGAQAQSDDYRRGYDQGYRDGAYAGRNGAGDSGNWRRRGGIEIESASYGAYGHRCDLRDSLRAQWRRSSEMNIDVNNRLCGDPAPGHRKQLIVRYRCNGGPVVQESTSEGRTMSLVCS